MILDFIILSVAAGLVAIAIWLYFLTKTVETKIAVDTSIPYHTPKHIMRRQIVHCCKQSVKKHRNKIRQKSARTGPSPSADIPRMPSHTKQKPPKARKLTTRKTKTSERAIITSPPINARAESLPSANISSKSSYTKKEEESRYISSSPPKMVKYSGVAHIPLKIYRCYSFNITVDLYPSGNSLQHKPSIVFRKMKGSDDNSSIRVHIPTHSDQKQWLELEFQAAGFTVKGDTKQKQSLSADSLHYQWNCCFTELGNHSFGIVFRVMSDTDDADALQIGRLEQSITVVKFDHLTREKAELWGVAAAISGAFLSGFVAVTPIIMKLLDWS